MDPLQITSQDQKSLCIWNVPGWLQRTSLEDFWGTVGLLHCPLSVKRGSPSRAKALESQTSSVANSSCLPAREQLERRCVQEGAQLGRSRENHQQGVKWRILIIGPWPLEEQWAQVREVCEKANIVCLFTYKAIHIQSHFIKVTLFSLDGGTTNTLGSVDPWGLGGLRRDFTFFMQSGPRPRMALKLIKICNVF